MRVEARGADERGGRVTLIAGAAGRTADIAAAVAVAAANMVVQQGTEPGVHTTGCAAVSPLDLLHHATDLGVRVQEFTGVARATGW